MCTVKDSGVPQQAWSGSPGLMLWNRQHWSYLHYVVITSEPEHFFLDKLITDALPLLEAPTAVRSVHLYKLQCGVTFDRSSSSNDLPVSACLWQKTGKTIMEQCEGSFFGWSNCWLRCGPTSPAERGSLGRSDLKTRDNAISCQLWRNTSRRHLIVPK